uniref:PH domain-containing protein n=1 Tax=Mycena chlorophos TaxID=658473 RepID=A0ABQ0M2X1_MYCCL|nr:predicted protein [Mycena chlorophos]
MRNGKSKLQESTTCPAVVADAHTEKQPTPSMMTLPVLPVLSTQASFPTTTTSLTSSLYYLYRPSNSPASWILCSATLRDDSVHLVWPDRSSHSIFLRRCADVRSMMLDELDKDERALIPADIDDLKIFQVGLEGESVEKFGTVSIRERARWVSAIWDVILPSGSTTGSSIRTESSQSTTYEIPLVRRNTTRALPPLPESPLSPARSSRLAISTSTYPPSGLDSPSSSRSKSPSIANLSHLSMVKNRLAQIESKQESQSVPSSPSPFNKNQSTNTRNRPLHIEIPERPVTSAIASPTSILDSYGFASALPPEIQHEFVPSPLLAGTVPPEQEVILREIQQMLSDVAEQAVETHRGVTCMQTQMSAPPVPAPELRSISHTLGDVEHKLRSDIPYIIKALADIQAAQEGPEIKDHMRQLVEAPLGICMAKLDQIVALLKEEETQRSIQSQQQMDSVRYLNELNSWLETFVNGGTAQIQLVAANVEKLCHELGCTSNADNNTQPNILEELRNLLAAGQMRDHLEALQHSVNNLAAMVASDSRGGFTPQTVANLIEKQRHDQEGLLRALAAELSNEIRGERLRFVDAMKEATAINVQMHVEELKKTLNREVRADLVAYYSKQRPVAVAPTSCAPGQIYHHQQQRMVPGPPGPRGMPDSRYAGHYPP